MDETVFAFKPDELSCMIGNLFISVEPPCGYTRTEDLTICGTTFSGNHGRLVVKGEYGIFYGLRSDLEAVRNGKCIERRCEHG